MNEAEALARTTQTTTVACVNDTRDGRVTSKSALNFFLSLARLWKSLGIQPYGLAGFCGLGCLDLVCAGVQYCFLFFYRDEKAAGR